jgi:hypothetical protein
MAFLYAYFFIGPIYDMYIAYSAESKFLGIAQYVPTWWVPSPEAASRIMTSKFVFFDPSWILPIGVSMLAIVFSIMAMVSVGYFTYAIYVKGQNLDFPVATATANTILSLAEREPRQMRIFMLAALFGVAYNTFVQFLPYVLGPFLSSGGLETTMVSSPIAAEYDMTPYLANILPGAGMIFVGLIEGIAESISSFLSVASLGGLHAQHASEHGERRDVIRRQGDRLSQFVLRRFQVTLLHVSRCRTQQPVRRSAPLSLTQLPVGSV